MNSILLHWNTRGKKSDSNEPLASITMDLDSDMPITQALQRLIKDRGVYGPDIEYGCFNRDGNLIKNSFLLKSRRRRNILYYMIRDLYNTSRGMNREDAGVMGLGDAVPFSPENNWGVIISEACPIKKDIERIIEPLVSHRSGKIITVPQLTSHSDSSREWIQEQAIKGSLPKYTLICDSFENIELEFQFILNAFLVTGRLWFDNTDAFEAYTNKVLHVEGNDFANPGQSLTIASPIDDPITCEDYEDVIKPIITENKSFQFDQLIEKPINKQSLIKAAKSSRFLALYCHGLALNEEHFSRKPQYQGAFKLDSHSKYNSVSNNDPALLTPEDVINEPFVPGGILFSPACLAGGTQEDSDFANWIMPDGLAPYLGRNTSLSTISSALLSSSVGPIAALLHFDISLEGPMFNPGNRQHDLQKRVHGNFINFLLNGQTIGKATKPFRSAAGAFYGQAISIFEQIAGTRPFMGFGKEPNIGSLVNSMNQYHIIASDMRGYIIIGDPAVRLIY